MLTLHKMTFLALRVLISRLLPPHTHIHTHTHTHHCVCVFSDLGTATTTYGGGLWRQWVEEGGHGGDEIKLRNRTRSKEPSLP